METKELEFLSKVDKERTLKYEQPVLILKAGEIVASEKLRGRKELYEIAGEEEVSEISFLPEEEVKKLREALLEFDTSSLEEEDEELEDLPESDTEIDRVIFYYIKQAVEKRASDVHLTPSSKFSSMKFRIHGELVEIKRFSKKANQRLINKLKTYAGLDIANTVLPQDGKFSLLINGKLREFRLSTVPTKWGERAVVRLLYPEFILSVKLKELGFDENQYHLYEKAFTSSEGLIIDTGGTGEGKSTTLLATVLEIAKRSKSKNIMTVEDPIEVDLSSFGVSQSEVSLEQGRTYPVLLRSFLRQDPDVIMVGEIRDGETAKIAVEASLTGHLVLTTLHASSSVNAIPRLIEIGIPSTLLATTVKVILAQRLLPVLCPKCRKKVKLSAETVMEYALPFDEVYERGEGCSECSSGVIGRTAVFELLDFDLIKDLVIKGVSLNEIKERLRKEGFKTLWRAGLEKVRKGEVSFSSLLSKVRPDLILDLSKGKGGIGQIFYPSKKIPIKVLGKKGYLHDFSSKDLSFLYPIPLEEGEYEGEVVGEKVKIQVKRIKKFYGVDKYLIGGIYWHKEPELLIRKILAFTEEEDEGKEVEEAGIGRKEVKEKGSVN